MTIFANPLSVVFAVLCGVVLLLVLLRTSLSLGSLLYLLGEMWTWLEERTQAYQTFEIPRYDDERAQENPLYRRARAYIDALPSLEFAPRATILSSCRRPNDFLLRLDLNQTVRDSFLGARLTWTKQPDSVHVRVQRRDCSRVLRPYLQYVEEVGTDIDARKRDLKLFTITGSAGSVSWRPVAFNHPATLDTLAMDPELTSRVRSDLETFHASKAYCHSLGRVWSRRYLLHGPPGTDTSGFASAMANFLCYDVYNLDLPRISSAADLHDLFLQTTTRSLILVENIDRHLMHGSHDGEEVKKTIQSLMTDIMEGVLSCCREEKVIVFTASSEEWDSTAIQPGKVDVVVKFSMCDFPVFKAMASNYLGLKDHKLYPLVEEVFQAGARLSPAEIGKIMMANRGSPSRAIKSVISALQRSNSLSNGESLGIARSMSERRRLSQSWSEGGGIETGLEEAGKDGTLRELRKLGSRLIRAKSESKKDEALQLERAAAALR